MDGKVGVGGATWQYNAVEADREAAPAAIERLHCQTPPESPPPHPPITVWSCCCGCTRADLSLRGARGADTSSRRDPVMERQWRGGPSHHLYPTPPPLPSPPLSPLRPALDVPFVWCLMTAVMEPSCFVITPAGSQAPSTSSPLALHRPRAQVGEGGWVRRGASEGQARRARGKISFRRSRFVFFLQKNRQKNKNACVHIMHMLGCTRTEWAPHKKKKKRNIIFTSSGIVWRVHWKLVQLGAFPAACLSTYPHFAALPIKM